MTSVNLSKYQSSDSAKRAFYYSLKRPELHEVWDYLQRFEVFEESKLDSYTRDAHDYLYNILDKVVVAHDNRYGALPVHISLHPTIVRLMWTAQFFNALLDHIYRQRTPSGEYVWFEWGGRELEIHDPPKNVLISYGLIEVRVGELQQWFEAEAEYPTGDI